MSLSPYINPTNLNGALVSTSKVGGAIYPDGFDKNTTSGAATIREVMDTVKDVSDTIENLSGTRAPMYVIGEINKSFGDWTSQWVPSDVSGLVRAVEDLTLGNEQDGVIIDGIGDVNGTFNVEFSSNPNVFRSSSIVDNRVRKPTTLRMTVMVSNYLNDNVFGTISDAISALDPTGLIGDYVNMLANNGNTRAQEALYKLRWLMENGKPFTVHTPHGIYENMLIKSIHPQTTDRTMDMLYCDIDFEEIIFYAPYTNTPGTYPARRGVQETTSGWTASAGSKVSKWLGGK